MKDYNNSIGVRMKHNKSTIFVYCMIAILMWIIGGWNTDNGDFSNYEKMYTYDILAMTTSNTPDYGFYFILEGFKQLGFSLIQSRMVIYLIFILTLSYVIFKLCRRPVLVLLLYFITFYFRDVITLRNTIAMIFLLLAIMCYISQKMKYRKIWFSILVLISSTIHISFVFYYVLLLADRNLNFRWVAMGSILLAFIGKSILGLLSANLVSEDNGQLQKKVDSLLESGSYYSLIICSITIILSYYMCKEAYVYFKKKKPDTLSGTVLRINVMMALILILTTVSMNFIRIFYNVLLFDFIIMVNMISYKKKISTIQTVWFLWVYLWAFWMSGVSGNFIRILSNNLII